MFTASPMLAPRLAYGMTMCRAPSRDDHPSHDHHHDHDHHHHDHGHDHNHDHEHAHTASSSVHVHGSRLHEVSEADYVDFLRSFKDHSLVFLYVNGTAATATADALTSQLLNTVVVSSSARAVSTTTKTATATGTSTLFDDRFIVAVVDAVTLSAVTAVHSDVHVIRAQIGSPKQVVCRPCSVCECPVDERNVQQQHRVLIRLRKA